MIALIARYHRRGTPKKAHPGYGELPGELKRAVRTLGALLRLAEGLDRSHEQSIGDLVLSEVGDSWFVRIGAQGDTELELWSAQRLVRPLEEVLEHPIRFELLGDAASEARLDAGSRPQRQITGRDQKTFTPSLARSEANG